MNTNGQLIRALFAWCSLMRKLQQRANWTFLDIFELRETVTSVKSVGYGGRYRIRTYDFHRVKMALYR
jgi:hypothetical protein